MPSINNFSASTAKKLAKILNQDRSGEEILAYGLTVLLSTVSGIVVIALMASILGVFLPTLAVTLGNGFLRISSGGGHCTYPGRCNLLGAIVFPLLGHLTVQLSEAPYQLRLLYLGAALLLCIFIVLLRAPVLTANKPLPEQKIKRLRLRSLITAVLISGAVILLTLRQQSGYALALATGALWQSLTLLPAGISLIAKFDALLISLSAKIKGGDYR